MRDQGIEFQPAESFLTRSRLGAVRGMHFQIGSAAHHKLIKCTRGRVLDVVVDVRPSSPHFNQPFGLELSEKDNKALLIGKNYAHGFLALEEDSWMLYSTSTVHNPLLDRGVLWSSISFDWPIKNPILSIRDQHHPYIQKYA